MVLFMKMAMMIMMAMVTMMIRKMMFTVKTCCRRPIRVAARAHVRCATFGCGKLVNTTVRWWKTGHLLTVWAKVANIGLHRRVWTFPKKTATLLACDTPSHMFARFRKLLT